MLVLCPAGLIAQSDLEARLDAVKEFNRYFRKAKDEALQVEAVMTLVGNECAPAAASLVKALGHKSSLVRDSALTVLGGYSQQETFQAWIDDLPKEKDGRKASVTIKLLGRSRIRGAVPAIEEYVLGARRLTGGVKYEVARALAAMGVAGEAGLLTRFLGDKDAPVRMAACDAVGKLIEPLEILAEVRKRNELYRIVIHAIAIGDFQKAFLQQLASQNGGVFVDMGR